MSAPGYEFSQKCPKTPIYLSSASAYIPQTWHKSEHNMLQMYKHFIKMLKDVVPNVYAARQGMMAYNNNTMHNSTLRFREELHMVLLLYAIIPCLAALYTVLVPLILAWPFLQPSTF